MIMPSMHTIFLVVHSGLLYAKVCYKGLSHHIPMLKKKDPFTPSLNSDECSGQQIYAKDSSLSEAAMEHCSGLSKSHVCLCSSADILDPQGIRFCFRSILQISSQSLSINQCPKTGYCNCRAIELTG